MLIPRELLLFLYWSFHDPFLICPILSLLYSWFHLTNRLYGTSLDQDICDTVLCTTCLWTASISIHMDWDHWNRSEETRHWFCSIWCSPRPYWIGDWSDCLGLHRCSQDLILWVVESVVETWASELYWSCQQAYIKMLNPWTSGHHIQSDHLLSFMASQHLSVTDSSTTSFLCLSTCCTWFRRDTQNLHLDSVRVWPSSIGILVYLLIYAIHYCSQISVNLESSIESFLSCRICEELLYLSLSLNAKGFYSRFLWSSAWGSSEPIWWALYFS